jgi:putative ABC transport system permease protein
VPAGSTEIWEVWFPTHVLVRTSRNAMALNRTIQERARALDSGITVGQIRSMEAVRSASLSGRRFNMALVSLFAALALVLAAIGIYGVIAYQVTERRHEIGIRMALGAERREILRLVMRQGLRLLAIGLTLGLMGGLALSRLFESYLFEVKALDPLAFTSAAVLLLSTGLLACAAPARGAAKVDPLVALRYE